MKLLLSLLPLLLISLSVSAQFENQNDFIAPNRTVHWVRGSTPVGSNPIWITRGQQLFEFWNDTIRMLKQATYNESINYKLLWIKPNGDVSAFFPNYTNNSDTSTMLSPYLRAQDTTHKWAPLLPYLLSYTETDPVWVAQSINYMKYLDTAFMLAPYLRKQDTTGKWAPKLPYLLSYTETDPLSFHISDTAARFSGYYRISNPAGYITNAAIVGKLNISDTSAMLAHYLKSISVRRVETYVGTSDGSGNYTITYSTSFPTIPDVQPQLQTGVITQSVRITASSTTSFTVNVTNRAVISLLGIDLIAGTATAVNGASVSVLVTAR